MTCAYKHTAIQIATAPAGGQFSVRAQVAATMNLDPRSGS
jgi:hypothetical protein